MVDGNIRTKQLEVGLLATVVYTLTGFVDLVVASTGDKSWTFNKCLKECHAANCSAEGETVLQLPLHMVVFGWDCDGECKYLCMWKTVDGFQKDGSGVPQFYGKWPFARLFGIQEPASALFSFFNGLSHLVMICYFNRRVSSSAPLYYVWHAYALIALNAWFWSVIFHIRDTNFTEMMDYFSAILLVLYSLFALFVRVEVEMSTRLLSSLAAAVLLIYFIYHVHYLAFVKFDYGYNMKANVIAGACNGVGWLWWAKRVWRRQPYVWKGIVSIVLVMLLLLLELGDFPPVLWILDAHALWHAGTAPVALLWYSFLVDDCTYMQMKSENNWSALQQVQTVKEKEI